MGDVAGSGPGYSEDDLLPISALQHLVFCERQCALIHIERIWGENELTIGGRLLHARAHEARNRPSSGSGITVAAGLALQSLRLGLAGRADVVEFHSASGERRVPFPVEYKHGKSKRIDADRVQLCAQALCLEEMCGVTVPEGALYYGATRRREKVPFTTELRRRTESCAARLRVLLAVGRTPPAEFGPKCRRCSIVDQCMPQATGGGISVTEYLAKALGVEG